nr:hypothetical protein [uncultured Methanobrevibacter sp.]
MKINKRIIFLIAATAFLIANAGFAAENATFKQYDFDSYFTMDLPQNITLEKTSIMMNGNITSSVNYMNETEKINILYSESNGTKDKLVENYKKICANDSTANITTVNNTTVIHFSSARDIGEVNYHYLGIAGDNEKYVMIQCDNETLMNAMAKSIKFKC